MTKIVDLLTRFSELYHIPQWIVNGGAIVIVFILIISPFLAHHLMKPKYHRFTELIVFKVLWKWKYKRGEVVKLWCYCPKCQAMLVVDDENCRSNELLQNKMTHFICNECGGNEVGRLVGGDRRYALSLVKREIWRHIKDKTFNEVSIATKEALAIYQGIILPATPPVNDDISKKETDTTPELIVEQKAPEDEQKSDIIEQNLEVSEEKQSESSEEVSAINEEENKINEKELESLDTHEGQGKKDGI